MKSGRFLLTDRLLDWLRLEIKILLPKFDLSATASSIFGTCAGEYFFQSVQTGLILDLAFCLMLIALLHWPLHSQLRKTALGSY